jgi:hypothetical protein
MGFKDTARISFAFFDLPFKPIAFTDWTVSTRARGGLSRYLRGHALRTFHVNCLTRCTRRILFGENYLISFYFLNRKQISLIFIFFE